MLGKINSSMNEKKDPIKFNIVLNARNIKQSNHSLTFMADENRYRKFYIYINLQYKVEHNQHR
jgi:hypothetical protein